jgi:hypothetical protein
MLHTVFPLLVALTYASAPAINLNARSHDPISCMKANPSLILIADTHGGEDPHGGDPHGGDPHDEQHDNGIQGNKDRDIGKAPDEPYPGNVPNSRKPYTEIPDVP